MFLHCVHFLLLARKGRHLTTFTHEDEFFPLRSKKTNQLQRMYLFLVFYLMEQLKEQLLIMKNKSIKELPKG